MPPFQGPFGEGLDLNSNLWENPKAIKLVEKLEKNLKGNFGIGGKGGFEGKMMEGEDSKKLGLESIF